MMRSTSITEADRKRMEAERAKRQAYEASFTCNIDTMEEKSVTNLMKGDSVYL